MTDQATIEGTVHKALALAFEEIAREHGVRVTSVEASWLGAMRLGGSSDWTISDLEVTTRSAKEDLR